MNGHTKSYIKILKKIPLFLLFFFCTTSLWVLLYRFINPTYTSLMFQRQYESKGNNLTLKKQWIEYEEISIYLKQALIVSEDMSFLHHRGFDYNAIRNAYYLNKKKGAFIYGASTITQQTAKNVFLWHGKSWVRKILEAYFTVLIELFWDKKRILEVYLNVVECGNGVFGAEAASRIYFNISAKDLTLEQASLIVAILPNPRRQSLKSPSTSVIEISKTIRWRISKYPQIIYGL